MGRKPLGRWFRRNLMWFVPLQSICLDPFVTVNNWFWFSERHQFSLILWEVAFASCDFYPISSKSFSLYIFKGIEYLQLKVFSCTKPKKSSSGPTLRLYLDPMLSHSDSLGPCGWILSPPDSSVHGIRRREYWSGLPCPLPGKLLGLGIQPSSLMPPALAREFVVVVVYN